MSEENNAVRHTPGPWVVDVWCGEFHVETREGDTIVELLDQSEQGEANARLIAAAPDLLAAARAAVEYDAAINQCANDPSVMSSFCTAQGDTLDTLYFAWLVAARDAIAKATEGAK